MARNNYPLDWNRNSKPWAPLPASEWCHAREPGLPHNLTSGVRNVCCYCGFEGTRTDGTTGPS